MHITNKLLNQIAYEKNELVNLLLKIDLVVHDQSYLIFCHNFRNMKFHPEY